jgi:hypothetical protein
MSNLLMVMEYPRISIVYLAIMIQNLTILQNERQMNKIALAEISVTPFSPTTSRRAHTLLVQVNHLEEVWLPWQAFNGRSGGKEKKS